MEMVSEETPQLAKDTESLKLFKNTKNYNWEIKIIGSVDDKMLKRLEDLDNEMVKRFGQVKSNED